MGGSTSGAPDVRAKGVAADWSVLDALPVAAAIATSDGRILNANAPLCEWLGEEAGMLVGRRLDEFVAEDDVSSGQLLHETLLAGGLSRYSVLQRYRCAGGRRARAKKSVSLLRDGAGNARQCIVVLDELPTEEPPAERAAARVTLLPDPTTSFRRLVEALPLLIWAGDETGGCTYVNPRWLAFTGQSADAHLDDAWYSLLHPDDLEPALAAWAEARKTRRADYETRFRIRRHDGEFRWMRSQAVPWQAVEGGPTQWLGCCIDIHDEVLATEALQVTSQRFDMALRSSPLILFSQDPDLRYTWIYNPAIGFRAETVLGRTDADFLERPEEALALSRIKLSVLAEGRARREEVTIHQRGVPHVFDLTVEPVKDPAGQVTGVTCACVDITERKSLELRLRSSEEALRQFIEQAPAALAMFDRSMRYVAHSGRWLQIFGFADENLRGRYQYDVFPDVPERWRDINRRAMEGGVFSAEEDSFVRSSGLTQWLKWEVRPWRNAEGEIGGVVIFCEDITWRKQAELALSGHVDRQGLLLRLTRSLLQSGQDRAALARSVFGMVAGPLEADFCLNYAIEADELRLVEHVGLDEAQLSRVQSLRIGEALCGAVAQRCEPLAAGSEALRLDPRAALARDLGARAYACHPLLARDGRILGTFSVASRRRDGFAPEEVDFLQTVCHFLALAWERLQSEERLAETDRKKDEFIATLAHELRNPLTPILTVGHLLEGATAADPKMRWGAEVIRRQVGHVVQLVEDLLDVTRITQGKLELRLANVSLADVLRSAVENTRALIDLKRHRLQVVLPERPLEVAGDRVRLIQIFQNLLDNAAKYTPGGGTLCLEVATDEEGFAEVRVSDDGLGIGREHLTRLFEMFYQVERSGQPPRSGLGIGLTLVKRLVTMHGGDIRVHSDGAGQGCTFSVRLPLASPVAVPVSELAAETDYARLTARDLRILVVDDNPGVAEGLTLLLETEGYEVHAVQDGLAAVDCASRLSPDIVLLDLDLPGMDGLEVARRIRAGSAGREILLVAQTGWARDEDRQRTEEAGFDAHFSKPIDPVKLLELLEALNRTVMMGKAGPSLSS